MKRVFLLLISLLAINLYSSNGKYRLTLRGNPATSIVVGWDQTSGSSPKVYYGTTDYGTDYSRYPNSKAPNRTVSYKGMNNNFARLTGLQPNTAYYFVIRDSQGTSQRFWFKTAPSDNSRLSFIAGGDSRNNRTPRKNANRLVAKLKPHAVLFGGDMTNRDSSSEWQEWFN
ncbi:fibronectin type III domain-containing protein, partial [Aquimarina sediminis]|uniref:fibronectin type III domain-containing protein n=1 Tax=Aquimarina sediminis TaxID=2070536 RepID=UPI0019D4A040